MRTAAVVVDWRQPESTLAALRSLAAMTIAPDVLVCVENGCSREEVARVRAGAPPGTAVRALPTNTGFAGGVNEGMAIALAAGAEWVLLLNNDAEVEATCLERCLEEAAPGVAVVGPAVVFADRPDRLWFAGGEVSRFFAYTRHRGLNRPKAELPPTGDTAYVSGCCALVSAAAWERLGPFRAEFFAYYEDAEWCQRARAAGWRCRYVGAALCRHAVSVSSGQRASTGLSENTAYYLARNPLRFALTSRPLALRVTRTVGVMVVWNLYNAWRLLRAGRRRVALAYLEGLRDALTGRMGARGAGGYRPPMTEKLSA